MRAGRQQVPASGRRELARIESEVVSCRACPRLVAWREEVAANPRSAFEGETYWGRPLPGFGDPDASVAVIGLAPAAHGGNRTGRMFTGDRSGDFLFAAMWRAGLASQPTSVFRDDGLELTGAWVTAPVRCAPPANKPTTEERDRCLPFLERELSALKRVRVLVALGTFAYEAVARTAGLSPRPRFGHGVEARTLGGLWVICSYHPSQQNTFTGKLTARMLDEVFARAVDLAADEGLRPRR